MKKRTLAMKFMSMALAAALAVGMSVTAFATEGGDTGGSTPQPYKGDTSPIDNISSGATVMDGGQSYPNGLTQAQINAGESGKVGQYVDMGWTVYKTGISGSDKDVVPITVSGIDSGATVTAYQIVRPVYENGSRFLRWEQAVTCEGVELVKDGSVVRGAFSRENLGKLAAAVTGTGVTLEKKGDEVPGQDKDVCSYSKDVQPGAWLVLVKGGDSVPETATYGPMVVSSFYTALDSAAAGTLGVVQNRAYAKRQDAPEITKDIVYAETNSGYGAKDYPRESGHTVNNAVASVGDEIWFDILVKNVPEYHGAHPKFIVTDTIDDNLVIDISSIMYTFLFSGNSDDKPKYTGEFKDDKLPFGGTSGDQEIVPVSLAGATVNYENNVMTINFANGGNYILNPYAGSDMVIRYKAKVVAGSGFGANEHGVAAMPNHAELTYTHNSAIEGNDGTVKSDDPTVYTLVLSGINKVDGADMTSPLAGAKFVLRPALVLSEEVDKYVPTENWDDAAGFYGDDLAEDPDGEGEANKDDLVLTSDENGEIRFEGIAPGTYFLKETVPNGGYSLNGNVYKVELKALDETGADATWSVAEAVAVFGQIAEGEDATTLVIPNVKMTDLPSTGGAGTALVIGLGICGAILGVIVIFGTRKKQED